MSGRAIIGGPAPVDGPELLAADITVGVVTSPDQEPRVTIKVELTADPRYNDANVDSFVIDLGGLGGPVNPYNVAAELMASADSVMRLAALDSGVDHQVAEKAARKAIQKQRRKAERKRRLVADELVKVSHCHACPRPVRVIEDGVSYCMRHAEEAGVRPKGKIQ